MDIEVENKVLEDLPLKKVPSIDSNQSRMSPLGFRRMKKVLHQVQPSIILSKRKFVALRQLS